MTPQNWVISEALASSMIRKPRAPQPFLTVVIKKLPWLECSGHCCSIPSKSQIMLAVVSVSRNRCLLTHFLLTSQSWWLNTRISTDAQSCLTLCDPMDYTVHGILQARILECVAIPISRGIFPTQGSNPGLLNCRWILYQLNHKESPYWCYYKRIGAYMIMLPEKE